MVGSVPYVNAAPLIWGLERQGIDVAYSPPSQLPALLDSQEVDAILVSSIEALRRPGARACAGVCIGSRGAVDSVRLFSKVPFGSIESLALDRSSMTSNRLAQVLLDRSYGVRPTFEPCEPILDQMLDRHDAGILIGDIGMNADGTGLHVLDLGLAWRELTGLPFVWALWVGGEELTPELAAGLVSALDEAESHQAEVEDWVESRWGWDRARIERYLRETMTYRLDDSMMAGLARYRDELTAGGWELNLNWPEFV